MAETQSPLSYASGPLASLGLYSRRLTAALVGRPTEISMVERELSAAQTGLVCLTIEGEPGIGKTRFLLGVEEMAAAKGFATIAVTADEEIRGPFLLARSIFGAQVLLEPGWSPAAAQAVQRVSDALYALDDPGLQSVAPSGRNVRLFDLAALAVRHLAAQRPLAILLDDLQWADEDSVRLLRYVVRANAGSRAFLVLASRSDEVAQVNEVVTLVADMDRMGLLRRMKLGRFSQRESTEFLQQVLGGPVNPSSAAVMHGQAEGVPFILAEQARAYRDAGMVQRVDGVWTLARNAERLLPSSVRTLIERRVARLPEATRPILALAAVMGRSFSLRDLSEVRARLGEPVRDNNALAEALAPALGAGLLVQHPDGSAADYSFTHERIRDYATQTLTAPRRRAIHEAIVSMLTADGQPPAALLPLLTQHAMAAGRTDLAAKMGIEAAAAALKSHAPDEALRLVGQVQPVVSSAQDRVSLLLLQDDALSMLRRPTQRLEGLAQLGALAEALGGTRLGQDVMLRRAAALRFAHEYENAADLARRVRDMAAKSGDEYSELAACIELGQNLLRAEIGEGFAPTASEVDLDGAAEAYQRALALAEKLGERAKLAAVNRELGIISMGRARAWFIERVLTGEIVAVTKRIAAGERIEDLLPETPIAPVVMDADARFRRALDIYEQLGDKQGVMSTIIAMAYVSWGPDIHIPGSARRIEEIRRLATQLKSLTKESERALQDAQMLYGCHLYALAKVFPESAIQKGQEGYNAARSLGERGLEFAFAGGMAMCYADLEDFKEAERWLGRVAEVAVSAPTPVRARRLELWRGRVRALAGDAAGMREHLELAVQLATDHGRPAPRCEALAALALYCARLGAADRDEGLLSRAESPAKEAKGLGGVLSGHPSWIPQADAALACVALARGDKGAAAAAGRAALNALQESHNEDLLLEVRLPAAEGLLAAGTEQEREMVLGQLRLTLSLLVPRFMDDGLRVRWLRGPMGRDLTRLAGPPALPAAPGQVRVGLHESESSLLKLLVEGKSNRQIAEETGMAEEAVVRRLAELYAKLGASSRADATSIALMGKLV